MLLNSIWPLCVCVCVCVRVCACACLSAFHTNWHTSDKEIKKVKMAKLDAHCLIFEPPKKLLTLDTSVHRSLFSDVTSRRTTTRRSVVAKDTPSHPTPWAEGRGSRALVLRRTVAERLPAGSVSSALIFLSSAWASAKVEGAEGFLQPHSSQQVSLL